MSTQPQRPSRYGRVDAHFFPPSDFVPVAMKFAMMSSAQRNRKLITHLPAKARGCEKRR